MMTKIATHDMFLKSIFTNNNNKKDQWVLLSQQVCCE